MSGGAPLISGLPCHPSLGRQNDVPGKREIEAAGDGEATDRGDERFSKKEVVVV